MMIDQIIIIMTPEEKDRIISQQRQEIAELKALVQNLMLRISELEHKKNSKNSSISPSQDPNRKRQKSLRKKSGKKPGGQQGHKGSTKKMVSTPDCKIDHRPGFCQHCRTELLGPLQLEGRRQVIDIPPIKPQYTEHRIYSSICLCCGHKTRSEYPEHVRGNVSYGPNIEAMAVYLNVRQYMPYGRMQEYFDQLLGVQISQGTLVNLVARSAHKSHSVYQRIKDEIKRSKWLGSDETGCRVNGKKHWYWTWQNDELTFITASDTRGFSTVEQHFPNGLEDSILVSDCLPAQLKQNCQAHQICLAHLYRDLNYLIEKDMEDWSSNLKSLLQKACELKQQIDYTQFANYTNQIIDIERQLQILLHYQLEYRCVYQKQLHKRLVKYQAHILTFLYHKEVPPDNNGSERAIRNVKVKQKISGQFKSSSMAQAFAILRSVIDTCIKRKVQLIPTLQNLALCPC
jgi:transposase